ncbi:MAG TPA: hypothetical protein VHB21_27560 [Minicystis sp.]|nr:hypothetical protein [Minicystis sp.]
MLARLLIGIVKGLILGGLVGFGLAKLGFAAPPAIIAYAAAAVTGVLIGLIAGKPIWAKDAKIEAGMKAVVGALLAGGLMYLARRFLTMPLPFSLGPLGGANESLGQVADSAGTLGGLAITSLAAVAAALGGFYEADNTPGEAAAEKTHADKPPAEKKRVAAAAAAEEDEDAEQVEVEKKQRQKR